MDPVINQLEKLSVADPAGAASTQQTIIQKATIQNSVGRCFLVVSHRELVEGIKCPSVHQETVLKKAAEILQTWLLNKSVLIVDLEGELVGFGGQLITLAVQPSCAIESSTLSPSKQTTKIDEMGLLLDLEGIASVRLAKRLMEAKECTKIMWGADGDCTSMMYQKHPIPLNMAPVKVVDAQLAFSTPGRRLGMASMLNRVPGEMIRSLPTKDQINWDRYHSQNRRAIPVPIKKRMAIYAVDDLERIEVILQTQVPSSGLENNLGNYAKALQATQDVIADIKSDPTGVKWLRSEIKWFRKKRGEKKLSKAVQIGRHLEYMKQNNFKLGHSRLVKSFASEVTRFLRREGVRIPSDLSFL